MQKDLSNMVLRYHVGFDDTENRTNQLIDFLTKTGIHRVILFSALFNGQSSFLPLEYYKKHAKLTGEVKEKLEKLGVEVGINILYTTGHLYWEDDGKFDFARAVALDGSPVPSRACIRNDNFIEYVKTYYGYYAELKPSVIFFDDDVRFMAFGGAIICLCDTHVKLISRRCGMKLTREEIYDHVINDYDKDDKIRKAYYDQIKSDRDYLVSEVCEAVHKISPDTEIGIMTDGYPMFTIGLNLKEFFANHYDNKVRRIRPHMNYYREADRKDIPIEFSMPAIERALIDDERVELQPEVENDIYGFMYKSNSTTDLQNIWLLTNGLKNMQLNIFSFFFTPADNYEEIRDFFARRIPYYNKLTELVPYNHVTEGISIYIHPEAVRLRRAKNKDLIFEESWFRWLQVMGLPMGYKFNESPWKFLSGDSINGATDEEIDNILKSGALIDLRAAEVLLARGFGDRIGVKSVNPTKRPVAREDFTDNDLNRPYKGVSNSDYLSPPLHEDYMIRDIEFKDGAEMLSVHSDVWGSVVCNGVTAYENESGERFVIMPTDTNLFAQFSNVNPRRKYQLINAFTWIARKELPIYQANEMVCVNINKLEDYNVIAMFNLGCDDVKAPKLFYKPMGKLYILNDNAELSEISYTADGDCIKLDKTLKACGTMVICDKK